MKSIVEATQTETAIPAKNNQSKTRLIDEYDYVANDIHSKLNSVLHHGLVVVDSVSTVQQAISFANLKGKPVSISGGRHSMGGQQFCHQGILLDMRSFNKVLEFDSKKGRIKVESGIMWADLIFKLDKLQEDAKKSRTHLPWSIIQKPTGADNLSLGGCLSSNIHGRGLSFGPFVNDIESFELVDAKGNLLFCSRKSNSELFKLAIGGYGLFGVIVSLTIRLAKQKNLKRHVEKVEIKDLVSRFEELISQGHSYGDCQFAIDNKSSNFLRCGILATYREIEEETKLASNKEQSKKVLSHKQWSELLELAHNNKSKAFEKYLNHYLATDGQTYEASSMQLSTYMDDYHSDLDKLLGCSKGTEIITELYVPRHSLSKFMEGVRLLFKKKNVNLIYGTIRLIKADTESFMPWAKDDYACVIFNLHTEHSLDGITSSANVFRKLIKLVRKLNGSFYLTYHRFVDKDDLDNCYPQFNDFLDKKLLYDPEELFQSQWYRHYRSLYSRQPKSA